MPDHINFTNLESEDFRKIFREIILFKNAVMV